MGKKRRPQEIVSLIPWLFNTSATLNSEKHGFFVEIRSTKSEMSQVVSEFIPMNIGKNRETRLTVAAVLESMGTCKQ